MRSILFLVFICYLSAPAPAESWVYVLGDSRAGISYDSASIKKTTQGVEAWIKIKNANPKEFGVVGMLKSKVLFNRSAEMKTLYTYTFGRDGNILIQGVPAEGRNWTPIPPDSTNYTIWQEVMQKVGF